MEAALKMARQYFVEIGEPQRRHFIGRKQSYHGNTLGALAVGGNEWRRKQFAPLLIETHHVSPCFEYRGRQRGRDADASTASAWRRSSRHKIAGARARDGDRLRRRDGRRRHGWARSPPVEGYFKRIREICDRHGILLILDEVMCGMGRTGTLHACEQEGIAPDLMAIAKGLGGGFAPIGAVLVRQQDLRRVRRRAPASSSTATPTWAIRWPAPARSPCSRSSAATTCWPTCAARAST